MNINDIKDRLKRDEHISPSEAVIYAQHAIKAEREACAAKAREFAGHYDQGSDGRNTFILLAEWIEKRTQINAKT